MLPPEGRNGRTLNTSRLCYNDVETLTPSAYRSCLRQGFDDGVNTVWVGYGMRDMIKLLYSEKGKKRKLFITGHSLGAALATVTAAHLAFEQNINITAIYTYGSPK